MGYVYATINKDTLAHICKEKGVSSEFLASKTKLNMSRLNQWLTPTDINLPTINQAKKTAACLHILVFLPVHFYGYSLTLLLTLCSNAISAVFQTCYKVQKNTGNRNFQCLFAYKCGGRYKTRTCDLPHVKRMRYQLRQSSVAKSARNR